MFRCHQSSFSVALLVVGLLLSACGREKVSTDVIFECDAYTLYADSLVEGPYRAVATSPVAVESNFSGIERPAGRLRHFRFALDGRDIEMDHSLAHSAIIGSAADTAVYRLGSVAGEPGAGDPGASDTLPSKTAWWTVRLDMRPVLRAFDRQGYYVTALGDTVHRDDFNGVWLIGDVGPVGWDMRGMHERAPMTRGHDSIYTETVSVRPQRAAVGAKPSVVRMEASAHEGFPAFGSRNTIFDASFNLAVDRLASTAPAHYYGIHLVRAFLTPDIARDFLRSRTRAGRIRRDPDRWPEVADHMSWAVGAWEVYCVTGDDEWLAEAYGIIAATLADDISTVRDTRAGMMHGTAASGSYFPRWMTATDRYATLGLTVNTLYSRAFGIASAMASRLGKGADARRYAGVSDSLSAAINDNLWIPNLGYYSQWMYSQPFPIQSQTTDNLGQSLAVLFGVASPEMGSSVVENMPLTPWGPPAVWPQPSEYGADRPLVGPYTQAYSILAAAKARNGEALTAQLAALCRRQVLPGLSGRAVSAVDGMPVPGSVAGNAAGAEAMAAAVMRVLAGISFTPEAIEFHPVVPEAFAGDKRLTRLRYRDAELDVTVSGTGDRVASFTIDGRAAAGLRFPASMATGRHEVLIVMANNTLRATGYSIVEPEYSPQVPVIEWTSPRTAEIVNSNPSIAYQVMLNGVFEQQIDVRSYSLYDAPGFTAVSLVPVRDERVFGYAGRPHFFIPPGNEIAISATRAAEGGTALIADKEKAAAFVELTSLRNVRLDFEVMAGRGGLWWLDALYANSSGMTQGDGACVVRSVRVNGLPCGALVMPPMRGHWTTLGRSNMLGVNLLPGINRITVEYVRSTDEVSPGARNLTLLHSLRLIKN